MLVLTRKPGESLCIETPAGEVLRITVCPPKTGHNDVRIGIDAPLEYKVDREEIYNKRILERSFKAADL